jgi:hypothetical protein
MKNIPLNVVLRMALSLSTYEPTNERAGGSGSVMQRYIFRGRDIRKQARWQKRGNEGEGEELHTFWGRLWLYVGANGYDIWIQFFPQGE